MKEKRIKTLKKQMPILDGLKAQAYFRDMAAEGKVLDEVGYLFYYFREEEPKDIRYATQVFTTTPSTEELAEYADKGWREVGHWEQEYVFATENPDAPELFDHRENALLEVERQIIQTEKEGTVPNYPILIGIFVAFGIAFFYHGLNQESFLTVWDRAWPYLVVLLFGIVFNMVQRRRLRKKKEELLQQRENCKEGRAEDEDWRSSRKRHTMWICVVVLLLGIFIYYCGDFNETTFVLPQEVSYTEIPAVRIEQLKRGDWEQIGEGIDPEREGVQMGNIDFIGNAEYRSKKRRGELYNFGMASRYLPSLESKVFTTQYLEEAGLGETEKMETTYYRYRLELIAERKFEKEEARNMGGSGIYTGDEIYWNKGTVEFLDAEKDKLDDLHVCMVTSKLGERLHILARQGDQLMEVKYSGSAEVETILKEIEAVFSAQEK